MISLSSPPLQIMANATLGPKRPYGNHMSSKSICFLGLEKPPQFWNPWWLCNLALGGLTCIFGASAIFTLVIYNISVKYNGIASYNESSEAEYFWKYLPTTGKDPDSPPRHFLLTMVLTVLVILLAFWGQADYSTRLLQPWHNLKKGETADRTIFLDFISPMLPCYWIASLRTRSWGSALTVTGCLVLQTTVGNINDALMECNTGMNAKFLSRKSCPLAS